MDRSQNRVMFFPNQLLLRGIFCPKKFSSSLFFIRIQFENLYKSSLNIPNFSLILIRIFNFQSFLKFSTKCPGYLCVINHNFVTTERIFKIRNSAESYCLAESKFLPHQQNLLIDFHDIHRRKC